MRKSKPLPQPELLHEFQFEFYGGMYEACVANDGQLYVRLSDVCDGIGLIVPAQRRRILEDEAISYCLVNIRRDTPYQEGIRRRKVDLLHKCAIIGTWNTKQSDN